VRKTDVSKSGREDAKSESGKAKTTEGSMAVGSKPEAKSKESEKPESAAGDENN
jgi:hypothetical protein